MGKKTTIIALFLIALALLALSQSTFARQSGTTYFNRTENGFPCGGLCNPNVDFLPQGSEAGCAHVCENSWQISCTDKTNPNWPYVNYTRTCRLTSSCGCDYKYKCPKKSRCVELDITDWNNGSCNSSSCCIAGETWTKTLCIKCNQEVKDGKSIVTINECVKKSQCGDPCGLTCPPRHCVVLDASKTGEREGYDCVLDNPVAKSDTNSASSGATVQMATVSGSSAAEDKNYCECKEEVAKGDFFWCPDEKGSCCQKDVKKCCGDICCDLVPKEQKCDWSILVGNYCNNSDCPDDKPQLCPGDSFNVCCKEDQECGVFKHGVAYCKNKDCVPGSTGYCAPGLCCTALEDCQTSHGISKCIPHGCPEEKPFLCSGQGKYKEISICCIKGCAPIMKNGYPQCKK